MTIKNNRFSIYKIYEDYKPDELVKKELTWEEARKFVTLNNEDPESYYNIIEEDDGYIICPNCGRIKND